jgi:hypothetical protein
MRSAKTKLALDSDECQPIDSKPNFVLDMHVHWGYISTRNR